MYCAKNLEFAHYGIELLMFFIFICFISAFFVVGDTIACTNGQQFAIYLLLFGFFGVRMQ